MMSLRTVITGGRMVTDDGDIRADIVIDDHEIVAVLATAEGVDADRTIDATDLLLLPGAVDICLPAPWLHSPEEAETARAAQQSAAAGGVTSFAADTGTPPTESGSQANIASDVTLWYPLDGKNMPTAVQISRLVQTGISGFTVALRPNGDHQHAASERDLYELMELLGTFGVPLGIQPLHPQLNLQDPMAERLAVAMLLLFAEESGAWVHLTNVTTGPAMRAIVEARGRGVRVTASVSALHLTLEAGDATRHIRTIPPLRSRDEIDELWSYVLDESVDCIGALPVRRASTRTGQVLDVQSSPSLFWDEAVTKRKMSHAQAVRMLSTNAAQILGIHPRKGTLRIGSDADIVLFDPLGTWTARDHDMLDSGRWSPVDGREITGFVVRTLRRGETVYDAEQHDEPMLAPGTGRLLERAQARE